MALRYLTRLTVPLKVDDCRGLLLCLIGAGGERLEATCGALESTICDDLLDDIDVVSECGSPIHDIKTPVMRLLVFMYLIFVLIAD